MTLVELMSALAKEENNVRNDGVPVFVLKDGVRYRILHLSVARDGIYIVPAEKQTETFSL